MRKKLTVVAVLGMALCLAACGSKDSSDKEKETSAKTEVSSKDAQETDVKENDEKISDKAEQSVDGDETESSFEKEEEMSQNDGENPIMNFVGNYQSGRATMLVEASGDNGAKITISWASSAWNESVYTMSGECTVKEDSILISYKDSTCRNVEYNSDGTVVSETTGYTDGSGMFTFKGNTVKWDDDYEKVDDGMLFEYISTIE